MKNISNHKSLHTKTAITYYKNCKDVLQLYDLIKDDLRKPAPRLPRHDFRRPVIIEKKHSILSDVRMAMRNLPSIRSFFSKSYIPQFKLEHAKGKM